MSRHHVPVGRAFGISIGLDYSWFLVFALLTWSLAVGYYPVAFPARSPVLYWILGAATALLLFASVVLHELGHALVARRYQIPVRSITLFIFGGVAEIGAEPPGAGAEFRIALAGPAVSMALAAVFTVLRTAFGSGDVLGGLVTYLAYINGMLGLFNLIPGFPLDGGRVLRAIVWQATRDLRRATLVAAIAGRAIAFLFILFGVSQMLAGQVGTGLWIAFIGWFLESAASAETQRQVITGLLAGHTVAEAMSRSYLTVSAGTLVQDLVDRHVLGEGRRFFVVARDGEALGLITLHQIKAIPRDRWPTTTAADAMEPMGRARRVRPETRVREAIDEMDRDGVNQLPVVKDSQILGILSREDVLSFLRTLQELGV